MVDRLQKYWVYGGFPAGIMLLVLLPVLTDGWPLVLKVVFLQLPIYMLHQFEEHNDDRFRRFVNARVGGGLDVLSPAAVWLVNIPGVWGVNVVSLYLAWAVDPGLGLIGIYLTLVNAVVHTVPAILSRSYNPGLATAVTLLFPFGVLGIWVVQQAGRGTLANQLLGLGVALLIHVALVVYVLGKRARLAKDATLGGARVR